MNVAFASPMKPNDPKRQDRNQPRGFGAMPSRMPDNPMEAMGMVSNKTHDNAAMMLSMENPIPCSILPSFPPIFSRFVLKTCKNDHHENQWLSLNMLIVGALEHFQLKL